MRHATKMAGQKVRDHYLLWYIERLRWFPRPVQGISVLMPLEQDPAAHVLKQSNSAVLFPSQAAEKALMPGRRSDRWVPTFHVANGWPCRDPVGFF